MVRGCAPGRTPTTDLPGTRRRSGTHRCPIRPHATVQLTALVAGRAVIDAADGRPRPEWTGRANGSYARRRATSPLRRRTTHLSLVRRRRIAENLVRDQPGRGRLARARALDHNRGDALLVLDRCKTDGMPTYIYFAGAGMRVKVDEHPSQVAEAFASAGGIPFRLTSQDESGEVYINPATVAFWSAAESSAEPVAPQDSTPPPKERQAVTDIWGKPLRKKRGR
jgi:hypothetical protein